MCLVEGDCATSKEFAVPPRRSRPPPAMGKPWGACAGAPLRIITAAPLPPTSLAAARPPSLLPPPFRADGDPPFYALAGEGKGRSVFVYGQHKLSYLKNTFSGGHKPSSMWSRALPGLLTSPPPFPFLASAHAPPHHRLVRGGQVVASGIPSFAGLPDYFSWAKDGPRAKTWRWP